MADELPVAFSVFAATLRPQVKADRNGRRMLAPGHPDEVWIKFIKMNHGSEKHSILDWNALIDSYRHQPAYKG